MTRLADILKRHASQFLAAAIIGAALAGCDDGANSDTPSISKFNVSVPASFAPHRARDGRVVVRTPPSWRETSTSGTVELNLRTDQPGSTLNLVVLPAAPGETLDKTMAEVPGALRHEFADFKEIRNEVIFLKEMPAGRLVYEASRGGFHGKLMQIFITRNGKHYILTYTAAPEHFQAEEPTVEKVVASIEIEK